MMATILVVDDDQDFLNFVARGLETAGYRVLEASQGSAALQSIRDSIGTIDLVVTDIVMPERDGLEVIMECRRQGVRALAMSGKARLYEMDILSAAKTMGAADRIDKPFFIGDLVKKVKTILGPK